MANEKDLNKFLEEMGLENKIEYYQKLMILIMLNNPDKKYICVPRGRR